VWSTELNGPFPDAATVGAMIQPVLDDPERLAAVQATGLGEVPNPDIDRMAMLAALALGTPYAAVTLVTDTCQMLAGCYFSGGTIARSMPLAESLCKFAVAGAEPFFIEDARRNPLSADNPLVRAGAFTAYAGAPLVDGQRQVVGALACWDTKPRLWTTGHLQVLGDLAAVVGARIFGS
jgi:GAF domain-containing protein